LGGAVVAAAGGTMLALGGPQPNATIPDPRPPAGAQPIVPDGLLVRIAIVDDVVVGIQSPVVMSVPMQTNGICMCIETLADIGPIDLTKIQLAVTDPGHDQSGSVVQVPRSLGVRDYLHGPYNETNAVTGGPRRFFLMLDDRLYNESESWRTAVSALTFAAGWLPGRAEEVIPGASVERLDTLRYPNFPVKTPTLPFRRADAAGVLSFEVATMNEFARNGSMIARVDAWAAVGAALGPVVAATTMTNSIETPVGATPSGLQVPLYSLAVSTGGLPDGNGEIRYKVFPWVGPPWSSEQRGEPYPTLNAPRGLPFRNDVAGNHAPLYGIVAQDGIGIAGTDLRGLSFTIAGAKASLLRYRDCAAVATAVRLFNASLSLQTIADGPQRRVVPHNDISGGVAVLLPIEGSVAGSNAGSYALRSAFTPTTAYPAGDTPFEIRSEVGTPDQRVRLRGVLANGAVPAAGTKQTPTRLLLRGIWLDGTGTTGVQNTVIDGTVLGAPAVAPTALTATYQLSVDCVITENASAGSASPTRARPGFVWDVRLRHAEMAGVGSMHVVSAHAGLSSTIGSLYTSDASTTRKIRLSTILGCRMMNVGVQGQLKDNQPLITGQLLLNTRIDFNQAITTPGIVLVTKRPAIGGLGIGNVFVRSSIDTGQPLMQISADGVLVECDNLIMRHFGHDAATLATTPSNGRVNLLYQDAGYTRINKVGTLSYCAFRCYTVKGDVLPATGKASAIAAGSFVTTDPYFKGAIVWDIVGVSQPASTFYQALRDVNVNGTSPAPLADATSWLNLGKIYNLAYGAQPLRQGNSAFRYHVGCRGNVASVTYNSLAFPGTQSGYGFAWGRDETVKANFGNYYRNPAADDYRPMSIEMGDAVDSPLLDRVAAGQACLPFDLAGNPRLNDGHGAAGAYERMAPIPAPASTPFVTNL